jgi:hypothetical protein
MSLSAVSLSTDLWMQKTALNKWGLIASIVYPLCLVPGPPLVLLPKLLYHFVSMQMGLRIGVVAVTGV